ncbi:hypothetical protein OKW30_005786 [Paraburkholderia sp. Clong3]|uniref:hypothetical protein n=1 Tax=unclassified Paraburkholderia TaxID=2615204 RepID=UPI001621F951|nr:hypothetical protein [Paraburkholderia sp. CI2]MBB5470837.1 hypothetical protein [Paraburkholderia sp. CI2]
MAVDHLVDLARELFEKPLREFDEGGIYEHSFEDHEVQLAAVGDRRNHVIA